jgi:hypothetical protein
VRVLVETKDMPASRHGRAWCHPGYGWTTEVGQGRLVALPEGSARYALRSSAGGLERDLLPKQSENGLQILERCGRF